ncbi:heme exporter protein CcmD [Hansschlegelia quercus]|uniref:Heme exporter protein D n=1 Tax=Hansschlegelia quercus TaxID=2528245 RepID=A0A4Q9GFU6_9HYPH|nr:heme exporter protein CcmD [Hansschlegelia quercus]TBN51841.1 heme exporter protein CcmD [Hansschlegelia quercus]
MNDPHVGFIVASYAIGFVVIGGLVLWTAIDHRLTKRALARVEAESGRRRSAR